MIIRISLPKMAWENLESYRDEDMIEKIIRANFFARVKEFVYDYHNLVREIRASHKLYYRYCYLPYSLVVDIEMVLCKNNCIIEFEEVEYLLSYIIMLVLVESAEARRYQMYFNYGASKKNVPMATLLNLSLYSCVRIGLPSNVWRGIVNHAIDTEDDVNETMEIVLCYNFFERYQDIINDHRNGIMRKTFDQLGILDYRGIFLTSDFVRDMRLKLDNDTPEVSLGDALSYLLIKILKEGIREEVDTAEA
ncbi:MAG: hypothetical protein WBB67_05270 [bacterium]